MAEHFKLLRQLLALSGESFEDELRHLGLSTVQLSPMEVLSALQHAEHCLGREFTKEEFANGTVGQHMLPEDFNQDKVGERLLADREASFNNQLDKLAEPLGAMFEKTSKVYHEIPKDAPVFSVDEIINLDTQKLQTEVTGAKIVAEIQDWLLTRVGSQETAVLPEDKMQRILVGAFNQLEIAMHVEMVASVLRRDAACLIKTVLVGTATKNFTDVIEAVFGSEEPEDVREAFDEVPTEEDEGDEVEVEEATASTSTATGAKRKRTASAHTSGKCKPAHPTRGGICSLDTADIYFPTTSDAGVHLHAGVDSKYISSRKSSAHTTAAGYGCLFSQVAKNEGQIVPDCDVISTTKAQLSTHIRQYHLGIAIGCYICGGNKRWWSAGTWMDHMKKAHSDLDQNSFYVKEGTDIKEIVVKEEVKEDDL